MRAVIIAGGAIRDYEYIKKKICAGDTIICADSGCNHALKMNLKIDLAVGDFDSASYIPQNTEVVHYPEKKDLTDMEIAFSHARERGFRDFLFIAAIGSRMDHTLTNILMLRECLINGDRAELVDEHNCIVMIDSHLIIHGSAGSIVSLVPVEDCEGVTTDGLEYPLADARLRVGSGRGVSNVMLRETASVSIKKGLLLVIIAMD